MPASPLDKPGEPFSLTNHKWAVHGIEGITQCEHCQTGEPVKTSWLTEHLALDHDLPTPSDEEHARRERERARKERVRFQRDVLDAARTLSESASKLAESIRDEGGSPAAKAIHGLRTRAMWLVGVAAIGYLVGGAQGVAVAIVLVLVVSVVIGWRLRA